AQLTVPGAFAKVFGQHRGKRILRAQALRPSVGSGREASIELDAKFLDERRHRAGKVLVLPDAVAMEFHDEADANAIADAVERDQLCALCGTQHLACRREPLRIEFAIDSIPVECFDPIADRLRRRWRGRTPRSSRSLAGPRRASAQKSGKRGTCFP